MTLPTSLPNLLISLFSYLNAPSLWSGAPEIGSLPLSFRIRHSEILSHSPFIGYLLCRTLPSSFLQLHSDGGWRPPEAKLPPSPDIPLLYPGNTISPVKLEAATLLDLEISRSWICEAYCCFSFSRRRMLWLTFRPGRTQVLSLSPGRAISPRAVSKCWVP